jgi:hypothetical protein
MPDFSLVPVDHQPDFSDVSLVPVDHDPFSADGVTRQAQLQPAQTQPQSPPQPPANGAGLSDVGVSADRSMAPVPDRSSHLAPGDSYPTADAAAVAALEDINSISQLCGLEYAGRVYQKWLGYGDYSLAMVITHTHRHSRERHIRLHREIAYSRRYSTHWASMPGRITRTSVELIPRLTRIIRRKINEIVIPRQRLPISARPVVISTNMCPFQVSHLKVVSPC